MEKIYIKYCLRPKNDAKQNGKEEDKKEYKNGFYCEGPYPAHMIEHESDSIEPIKIIEKEGKRLIFHKDKFGEWVCYKIDNDAHLHKFVLQRENNNWLMFDNDMGSVKMLNL